MTAGADPRGYLRGLLLWLQQIAADRKLPPMALHVATILARHVNQTTGDAWPSLKTIAKGLGIKHVRSVIRNVNALAQHGHLEVATGGGRTHSNHYRPVLKTVTPASSFDEANGDSNVIVSGEKRVTREAGKSDARDTRTVTLASPESIERTSRGTNARGTRARFPRLSSYDESIMHGLGLNKDDGDEP
ncbi:helix-turn-helix domain-containing protein [Bradyrhizobium sp. Leo170]|uniref:helix-turn-helix domain-containing protein n=1 Tax=Bradyrhizobium sp. Leo170 TaxID=1571199 RepID=UPI00102EA7BF|nr:helix-turn-helix domain-containing protein [Bradyrhizobium sp. Leo170]TAI65693.1 hypothetical protein CWO89_12180 [Bradyrhizobium sp. Leo170]